MGEFGKGLSLAFFLALIFCHVVPPLEADDAAASFPLISRLDSRDDGFKQFIADVEVNRRVVFSGGSRRGNDRPIVDSLAIYQYVPREGEDLFFLAARCSIPYSTLASLNRLRHPSIVAGSTLLLPTVPGIFVPQEPESDLENLLASSRLPQAGEDTALLAIGGPGEAFYFFPGSEFGPTERAFFLNRGFRFPLRSFRLTSGFGMRQNPVTGNMRFHHGLDLAAPLGTEVFAAGDGVVTEIGSDPILGNYIIIRHDGGWASVYGHLQRVGTALQNTVRSGMLIGWVGSTGQSTGPHLHFELRQNGRAQNPDKYLFMQGGR
jgi:murein DD-endopeptidase MepM/ murein hydrolase activator NlpD